MGVRVRMGEPKNDVSRLREAFASVSRGARPGADCPDPQRLWAAATGELRAWSRRQVVDHTSTCAACAEAWRLARELAPEPVAYAASEPWSSRIGSLLGLPWSWNVATLAGAAAAVVLSVAVTSLYFGPSSRSRPGEYRDPGRAPLRSLLPEGQALSRENALLRWSAGQPGSRYHVTVTAEDLRPIAAVRDLEVAQFPIPAERLSALPAGAKLLWQVEARLPDGGRVRSDTFVVRLQ